MSFWQKLGERFTSTKFLAALSGVVFATFQHFKGEISTEVWVGSITALVAVWNMAQARVDAAKKSNGT